MKRGNPNKKELIELPLRPFLCPAVYSHQSSLLTFCNSI
ncbi:unnamed protein product [Larinioides sclopetarius]|uniref:Uncharacterized protein n=1 Tax=Larinioides sclopetarius TaxID=280406 RepID=A0AAV1Z2B2_9ARAC